MHPVLIQYRNIQAVTNDVAVEKLLSALEAMPPKQAADFFAQSHLGGGLYVFGNRNLVPGVVLEQVHGHLEPDTMVALYSVDGVVDKGVMLKAREDMISAISTIYGALPSVLRVPDPARGRDVALNEMATAQLQDLLASMSGK